LLEPGAPSRVAMVDAELLARLEQESGKDGRLFMSKLVELLGTSNRYVRCPRCGALSRIGNVGESWLPGPVAPPAEGKRRVVHITCARVPFGELWRGERAHEVIRLPLDVGTGDLVRIVETLGADQRDPAEAQRYVLAMVTCVTPITQATDGTGKAVLGLRVLKNGHEERAADARRERLKNALSCSPNVAGAAQLMGISVAEAYRWIHDLGLNDQIRTYKPRTRKRGAR
jgi:hypothetical protein